jgi:serine/threonine-protein kinase
MGKVFHAIDTRSHRDVALKVATVSDPGSDLQRRMRREAHLLRRVKHPNVVSLIEAGVDDGQAFVVMELVAGLPLSQWVSFINPTLPERFAVLLQAGKGLAAAHAAGILHRDFKPANVMVDETGSARVLDFGLARLVPGQMAQHTIEGTMTAKETLIGTLAYMAPEQIRGERADEASDQFAYCVTFFESIFGWRPFQGRRVSELLAEILRAEIRFPDEPRTSTLLKECLARGLRPNREERYPSMRALLDGLERGIAP